MCLASRVANKSVDIFCLYVLQAVVVGLNGIGMVVCFIIFAIILH